MKISWMRLALDDIFDLHTYLAENDRDGAKRMAEDIHMLIGNLLPANTRIGRPGRVEGTREFEIPDSPFIVPYRAIENEIYVLRVFHKARRWVERTG